ncbi:MAG: FlgD immunoglobulin-like domain containing protein [Muribaculaceae bacterium]|nr:FlgD immunoglobulin-like domain containing protein [Muribaculaceae bacterium]
MNKTLRKFAFAGAALLLAGSVASAFVDTESMGDLSFKAAVTPTAGTANAYAYGLAGEYAGGVLNVSYSLNAAATDVNVVVKNSAGEVVYTQKLGAQAAGAHTAAVNLQNVDSGDYSWAVSVATAKETVEQFVDHSFYHPSGLDVDNNPFSASFGTLFVAEGYTQGKTEGYISAQADGSDGGGLYMFAADGTQILNKDGKGRFFPSNLTCQGNKLPGINTSSNSGADFNKVRVAEDGRVFVGRYNFDGSYYLVAPSVAALVAGEEFTSLVEGWEFNDSIYRDTLGNFVAGPAQGFDVVGAGEDLKLITLARNTNRLEAVFHQNAVVEYALGTAATLPAPTSVEALDMQYTISYDRSANIACDNRGGIWYVQYRGAPADDQPALLYVNAAGEIKYFEGAGGKVRRRGALAVNPEGTRLAAASASGKVGVYDITYAEDGTVTLTEVYDIANGGNNTYSAAWDYAGNLYLGNASTEYVRGYAIPQAAAVETPAAGTFTHVGPSKLPEFAPVREVTVTKVWECSEAIPGSTAGGDMRFATGTDDDVIFSDKAARKIYAWDAAGKRVIHDLTAFFEATAELHTVSQVIEKIDTISVDTVKTETDTTITVVVDTTWADKKTLDGMGSAISMDDAGNIVVNTNFPNAPSSEEFIIIPADGSEYKFMKLDMAAAGATAARFDQLGRIVGDVLSAEGAYMWINPNGGTKVAVIKVAEGAQVADYSMAAEVGTQSTSMLAQPAIFTVEEIDAMYDNEGDVTPSFWLRNRSTAGYVTGWSYNEDDAAWTFDNKVTVATGGASNEGFATFTLQGETYFVVPVVDGSNARSAWMSVVKTDGTVVATIEENIAGCGQFAAIAVREINETTAIIYHWLPGKQVAVYAFQLPTPAPKLYAVGEFQGWDIANPEVLEEKDGVYTLEFGGTNCVKEFKVSTVDPENNWDKFNSGAIVPEKALENGVATKFVKGEANITVPFCGAWSIVINLADTTITATASSSTLPNFAPVSEVTVTKVWESTEAIPGSQYGGELRFNTGTDDDVILIDKANYQVLAWDAAGKRVLHDLKAFFEATEGLYTVSQVIAKVDTISVDTVMTETDTTITVVADTTWADKKTIDGMGTAIAMDDAGNIVVNTNFPNGPSSEEFIILPADGSEYKYMKLDMAAAGATAARFDQLGRIVGDVLSAEGAYMWINPSAGTKVAVIKVAEGAQVADYSMAAEVGLTQSTSTLAQPAIFSVEEIDAMYDNEGDVTPTFWLRNRSTSGVVTGWTYNEEEGAWKFDNAVTVATGAASNEGFATFQLQGETYFVVPVVDGAGARSAWFNITKADGTVMATVEENFAGLSSFNSFSAIELDDNTAIIYRWLPAKQVAVYAFQLPAVDGVEGIVADEEVVDAPAVYYNLNGVKVVNPSKGIYIVKRGNKVSKEYIR